MQTRMSHLSVRLCTNIITKSIGTQCLIKVEYNHDMPLPVPFTFSQSSLQDYQDCQRRFQLRYIEKLDYPATESEPALENELHLKEGEYFHRLVQQHLLNLPDARIARLATSPNLQRWWDNF